MLKIELNSYFKIECCCSVPTINSTNIRIIFISMLFLMFFYIVYNNNEIIKEHFDNQEDAVVKMFLLILERYPTENERKKYNWG